MRRMLICVLLATLGFASAAYGATASAAAAEDIALFTTGGIKVDATAQSPRAAHDLAMAQGRPLAWSKLFRRFTVQDMWGSQPLLADNNLLGLILSVDVGNERRSMTRYVAEIIYHFNPAAVRQLLRRSDIAFSEARSEAALVIPLTAGQAQFVDDGAGTRLTANVRFDTMKDWAKLRARLGAMKSITEIEIVGLSLHEAQIDLTYIGQMEQLRDGLAQRSLDLGNSGGQYTLELGTATAANSPF